MRTEQQGLRDVLDIQSSEGAGGQYDEQLAPSYLSTGTWNRSDSSANHSSSLLAGSDM